MCNIPCKLNTKNQNLSENSEFIEYKFKENNNLNGIFNIDSVVIIT